MAGQNESRPGAGVVWASVEDGFHVGSRDGNFLGYVDRHDENSYVAFDMRSRLVGRFPNLADAMKAVVEGTAAVTLTSAATRDS